MMKTDIQIAQEARMEPIVRIAEKLSLSEEQLELYGRYVVGYARSGKNLTRDIMELSVKMYGYEDVEDAERKLEAAWKE